MTIGDKRVIMGYIGEEAMKTMYHFMLLEDEITVKHSNILGDGENKSVEVYFERERGNEVESARCSIPSYEWILRDGFTDEEIQVFTEIIKEKTLSIYKYAEGGGLTNIMREKMKSGKIRFEISVKELYCEKCETTNFIYDDMEEPYKCDDCGAELMAETEGAIT